MTLDKRKELLTKAKSIRFDTEMVRAILDGRKTVTRRAVKPQPVAEMPDNHNICKMPILTKDGQKSLWYMDVIEQYPFSRTRYFEQIAPYEPGDILYVRETWFYETFYEDTDVTPDLPSGNRSWRYVYKADHSDYPVFPEHWHPSIHMPKEAARIFLRVTGVRVERLQDINDEEALKEGCGYFGAVDWVKEPLPDFRDTWNSTVKKKDLDKYGWHADPWVWVVEFERADQNGEN